MKRFVVGIDVGGTNVKLGLVNSSGRIISRTYFPTKSYIRSRNKLIDAIAQAVLRLLRAARVPQSSVLGIGLGLPGLIDPQRGFVNFLPNIPGWKNVPLKKMLEKKLRLPVFIDNDAKIVALAEWKFGSGRGFDHLVCLTLGTGVGSGLILDGRLYRGADNTAGELGHLPLNEKGAACNCGGVACLERTIGNRYLVQRSRKIFGKGLEPQAVGKLAKRGDARALRFWKETAEHLGNALAGVVNLLNPQCIVVGGGVANNFRFMRKTLIEVLRRRALRVPARRVKVVRARLVKDAGILGARVLVEQSLGRSS